MEGHTWVACDLVVSGTPHSLTKRVKDGEPAGPVALSCSQALQALAFARRVAQLSADARLAYVARVARGPVEEMWVDDMAKVDIAFSAIEEPDKELLDFLKQMAPASVTVEVGSMAWRFSDERTAHRFRSLDTLSRSVLCAALFDALVPPLARKLSDVLPEGGVEHTHWAEFPDVEVPSNMGSWDCDASRGVGCHTVPLAPAMNGRPLRAAARSLASHLHFLLRRLNVRGRVWILHISKTGRLQPSKLDSNNLHGLDKALENDGWVLDKTKAEAAFSYARPCFVLICPRGLLDRLKLMFISMLDRWQLVPQPGTVWMRAVLPKLGRTLLSVAQHDRHNVSLETATRLCMRGAQMDSTSLEQLIELVAAMPCATELDLS